MRPSDDLLMSRALSALEEECEIPPELEARILAGVLEGPESPVPVVRPAAWPAAALPGPLEGVLRAGRRDARRATRMAWGAAAAALALVIGVGLSPGAPTAGEPVGMAPAPRPTLFVGPGAAERGNPAPVNVNATQVAESDPLMSEARLAMSAAADRTLRDCKVDLRSAVVWFETTGYAAVFEVSTGGSGQLQCVEAAVAKARIAPRSQPLLVQLAAPRHGSGAEAVASAERPRVTAWLIDET